MSVFSIEADRSRVFTYEEAKELLPLVYRITQASFLEVQDTLNFLDRLSPKTDADVQRLESEINEGIRRWQTKMEKLGLHPNGMWVADFDSGDGYYCWKYPEHEIKFWHGYKDGFAGRVLIKDREKLVRLNKNTPTLEL